MQGIVLVLLVALLSGLVAASGPCYFPTPNMVLGYEETQTCLRSIPFDQAVAVQTVNNVLGYLEAFVFQDRLHNPPAPYTELQTNVVSCVEELKTRVLNSPNSFSSDYDFHQALSDIFLPYRDPHTMYSKPACYQKLSWVLPIALRSEVVDGVQKLFVDHLPPEYGYFEVGYWSTREAPEGLYGAQIDEIEGEDPLVFLTHWADEHVYSSKTQDSRINSALSGDFWLLGGRYYGVPTRTLSLRAGGKDFIVEWGATNKVALYGPDDFASYCPVLDVPWSEEAAMYLRTRVIESRHPHIPASPWERLVEETRRHSAILKENVITGEEVEESHLRKLIGTSDVSFYLYEPEGETNNNNDDVVVLLNIPSFSPDDVPGFVDTFLEGIDRCNELGITHLIVNLMSNGGGWVTLGYRVLRVLAPWVYPVYGTYDIRHSPLAEVLLDSALSESVQTHLQPESGAPFGSSKWYTESVERECEGFEGCGVDGKKGSSYTHDFSQRYYFTVAYDEHSFTDAFARLDSSRGLVYGRSKSGGGLPPQNIIFLSDGLCGSTCACTSKRAQEAHAGIVVGVGGLLTNPPSEMDVASFAGGSVSDNSYMESFLEREDYSLEKGIPYPMPTNAVFRFAFEEVFGWDGNETPLEFVLNSVDLKLPYWPRTGSAWLEDAGSLVKMCVDKVFSVYSSGSEAPALSAKCLPWMVTLDERCTVQNGRGGYPCKSDGSGYDQNQRCVVYECDAGYYRSEDKLSCLPLPNDDSGSSSKSLGAGAIATIVICSLAVIALVVIAVLIHKGIIRCGKKGKESVPLVESTSSNDDGTSSSH